VIGLGLMGGSWAGALQARGWQVWAVERQAASLEQARERGWIREGWSVLPARLDVDLVIIALPLPAVLTILPDAAACFAAGTIVMDVSSLKTAVCAAAPVLTAKGIHFVGGHPMTGSEKSGFEAAKPDLFYGYPYVLTPLPDCPAAVLEALRQLIGQLGARLVLREPALHDQEAAMISHIPHVLSVALTLAAGDMRAAGLEALELAGRSFREMTRIADSSPEMWREIMLNNAEAILAGLKICQERLDEFRGYIEQGDGDGVAQAFQQARRVREDLF
jgi:prephenate dehydrogenase